MYVKMFPQMLDSSVARDPDLRHIWMDLLLLADQDGVIDMPIDAIAQRTRVPEDRIREAIDRLCAPDPDSRTPDYEGRRLLPLEGRPWGWRAVNYGVYRELRSESDRRERQRAASERYRGRKRLEAASSPRMTKDDADDASSSPVSVDVVSSSPSSSSSPGKGSAEGETPGFDRFWEAWPRSDRKAGRCECRKRWIKAGLESQADHVISVLDAFKASRGWTKDKGEYIPAPMAWINQGKYDADPADLVGRTGGVDYSNGF